MGIDIHLYVVREKKALAKEFYEGRNSEWFSNLNGNGWKDEYDHLPKRYGFSDQCPDWIEKKYKDKLGYYGFAYINVGDYKDWFEKYHPDIDAGWVNTYDKWRIEHKGYIPEDLQHYLSEEDNINDMHFIEVENKYDNSKWLYEYLEEYNIPDDADIWFCFDR